MAITWRPERLYYDDIAGIAERFLEEHHPQGTPPVPIEEIVEFDLGLEILPIDSYGVEAFLSWNRAHVYVDRQTMLTVPGRYRFSLAHEVGHYVMHRGLFDAVRIERPSDVREIQRDLGDDYRWVEWQANAFAGLVLIPRNLLRAKIAYHESRAKAAGFPPSILYEGEGFDRLVQSLSEIFGVSREPVEIRLSKDNFI